MKAALASPDGRVQVVHFHGRPWLASQVFVAEDGTLCTAAEAGRCAASRPDRLVSPVPYVRTGANCGSRPHPVRQTSYHSR